jgi:CO/xanthine dehydrogenase FAD-binding subunit
MDLPQVERFLQPTHFNHLTEWQPGWFWLAGGTWLFSEPETRAKVLVDLASLHWSEIEVAPTELTIGATCKLADLAKFSFPSQWTSTTALKCAVHELASFKISNAATVGGNLCLALPASTFAPVMVVLGASYEIFSPHTDPRQVAAINFQTGAQQTVLQPGEALRKITIPAANLGWQIAYQRMCLQTAGYALAIVIAAYDPATQQVRYGIGASTPTPFLLTFAHPPTPDEITQALDAQNPNFIHDERASAAYRRHITAVLMRRTLAEVVREKG